MYPSVSDLIGVMVFVAALGALLLVRVLKLSWTSSLLIAAVKVAIPCLYFVYWYDPRWSFRDDVAYFTFGELLVARGYDPITVFFIAEQRDLLFGLAGGAHVLYIWWNLLAMYFFGPFYVSPVLLNVGTTFASACLLYKIARASGLTETYAKWLGIFFLFHWDVLAWSSIINLKDMLVMLITLVIVYSGMQLVRHKGKKRWYAAALAGSIFAILWLRYYVPVFLLGALGVWAVFVVRGWKKIPWAVAAAAGIYIVFPAGAISTFRELAEGTWIAGPIRAALTPQPWAIIREYDFLTASSWLHWGFICPATLAGLSLFWRNAGFRFAAIFFVEMIFIYGLVPDLQGPRHRAQLAWVLAWAQYEVLWQAFHAVRRRISAGRAIPIHLRARLRATSKA